MVNQKNHQNKWVGKVAQVTLELICLLSQKQYKYYAGAIGT